VAACFSESPSRYLLEVTPSCLDPVTQLLSDAGRPWARIGELVDHDRLMLRDGGGSQLLDEPLEKLRQAWLAPLDW